jgi:hypothetical protein
VYICSPSVNIDGTWQAVKEYQEQVMKVRNTDKSTLSFDHSGPEYLHHIIATQHKIILHMKTTSA